MIPIFWNDLKQSKIDHGRIRDFKSRAQEDINLDKKVERDMIDRDMCGSLMACSFTVDHC